MIGYRVKNSQTNVPTQSVVVSGLVFSCARSLTSTPPCGFSSREEGGDICSLLGIRIILIVYFCCCLFTLRFSLLSLPFSRFSISESFFAPPPFFCFLCCFVGGGPAQLFLLGFSWAPVPIVSGAYVIVSHGVLVFVFHSVSFFWYSFF